MLSLPKVWDIQEKFIHFVEVRIFYMRKYRYIIYNFKLDGIFVVVVVVYFLPWISYSYDNQLPELNIY